MGYTMKPQQFVAYVSLPNEAVEARGFPASATVGDVWSWASAWAPLPVRITPDTDPSIQEP